MPSTEKETKVRPDFATSPVNVQDTTRPASSDPPKPPQIDQLEREETALWRLLVLFLLLVATALAANFWENLRLLPERAFRDLAALPVSVLLLVGLLAAYVWRKKQEIAELRAYVRGLHVREESPPTDKQVEKLLEIISRSQLRYRELIDSFDDVIFALGLDGEIQAVNRRFTEITEEEFPKLIGHKLQEFVDEPALETTEKNLARFIERRSWQGIVRVRLKKSGGARYFECSLRAVVKDGEVVGVSGLAHDVTFERESEARFTQLFETLQEGVYFTTPDGKLLDANPALVRMLGYDDKAELLDVNVVELYYDAADRAALMEELEKNSNVREREIMLRRRDGSPIQCLDTSSAIRDSSGRVVRYQGTLVDITHRREMERRLHEEKEFARRLVDSLPDLVVVLDIQGRYTYVSPRIKEVLGFTPEELVAQSLGERTHEDDRNAMKQLHSDVIEGKRSYATLEYRTLHKDGSWRCLRATASPLYDAAGQIFGVIASARDMTEMKRLEQTVIQSEKLAAMGQMIAGVAHELNNPLTAILGINELLRERAVDDASRRQLEVVQRQARRAAEIVQNLLTFARPPAPHKTRLHLGELVLHTLQLHEYSLRLNNIKLDFDPRAHVPSDMPRVVGDQNQLMQVFLNLIVNAEQAIHEVRNEGVIRVRMGANLGGVTDSQLDPTVWVTIQDDGPGIAPDILPKIFDPFFTTKRPGRGTGLGLSICMAILREHGGTIEARPLSEGGAQFRVAFPVRLEDPLAARSSLPAVSGVPALREAAEFPTSSNGEESPLPTVPEAT